MSYGAPFAWKDKVTDTSATRLYPVGTRRLEPTGKEYTYQQADDAITANQAVMLDVSGSSSSLEVTPTAAATDPVYGVAEVAFTDEYYGWICTKGPTSAIVANGVAAGKRLTASGTAGVLTDAVNDITAAVTNHNANSSFSDTEVEGFLNALGTAINATIAAVSGGGKNIIAMEANSSGDVAVKKVHIQ